MNKPIKMIDLFNKIVKGEEVPQYIYHNGIEYEFKGTTYYDNYGDLMCSNIDILTCLNDEVEIIEEQEEIDIQGIEENNSSNPRADVNQENINLLIKAVQQLDKKIKEVH